MYHISTLFCLLYFVALSKGLYRSYGKLLALSLINGGKVCHCLCRSVFNFIVDKEAKPEIDDVPYTQTRDTLAKVYLANHLANIT
jgi:hypothetical protein